MQDNTTPFTTILENSSRGNKFGATSSPFFLQRPSSPTQFEDTYSFIDKQVDGKLPSKLVSELYSKIPDTEELYAGPTTLLSLEEVRWRRNTAENAGTKNDFLDFAVEYVGMGRVVVASVNVVEEAHIRVDGGANAYEREENYKWSLNERNKNTDFDSLLKAISSFGGIRNLLT